MEARRFTPLEVFTDTETSSRHRRGIFFRTLRSGPRVPSSPQHPENLVRSHTLLLGLRGRTSLTLDGSLCFSEPFSLLGTRHNLVTHSVRERLPPSMYDVTLSLARPFLILLTSFDGFT